MIEFDGYVRLNSLVPWVQKWISTNLVGYAAEAFPNEPEIPYRVIARASNILVKQMVAFLAREGECTFFAFSLSGESVRLSSEIFERERPSAGSIFLKTTEERERDGQRSRRNLELDELVLDDAWKNLAVGDIYRHLPVVGGRHRSDWSAPLDAVKEEVSNIASAGSDGCNVVSDEDWRKVLSRLDRPKRAPVDPEGVPVINWASGTIDLAELEEILGFNDALWEMRRKAEALKVTLPMM